MRSSVAGLMLLVLAGCTPHAAPRYASGSLTADRIDVPVEEPITDDSDDRWGQRSAAEVAGVSAYEEGRLRGEKASERMRTAMGYKLMGTPTLPDWLRHELVAEGRPAEYVHGVEAGYVAGVLEIKRQRNGCLVVEGILTFFLAMGGAVGAALPH